MLSFKDLKELREESMFQIRPYSREMQSILIFHSGRRQSRVVNEEKLSFISKKYRGSHIRLLPLVHPILS